MSTLAILADIIDTWTDSGNRLLAFARFVALPIAVVFVAFKAFLLAGRAMSALIGVVFVGAFFWMIAMFPQQVFSVISGPMGFG